MFGEEPHENLEDALILAFALTKCGVSLPGRLVNDLEKYAHKKREPPISVVHSLARSADQAQLDVQTLCSMDMETVLSMNWDTIPDAVRKGRTTDYNSASSKNNTSGLKASNPPIVTSPKYKTSKFVKNMRRNGTPLVDVQTGSSRDNDIIPTLGLCLEQLKSLNDDVEKMRDFCFRIVEENQLLTAEVKRLAEIVDAPKPKKRRKA